MDQQEGMNNQAPEFHAQGAEKSVEAQSEKPAEHSSERPPLESGAETRERAARDASVAADNSLPTALPAPSVVQDDDSTSDDPVNDGQLPAIAADDDLIEKEWVDKAKKIVHETKDDPYSQEKAVTNLRQVYKKKRYGEGVGDAA